MLKIKIFQFNAFQVNTILLFDETKECVIIDAACYHESEQNKLIQFIEFESLKPVRLINTHCHIDHILGCNYISDHFKLSMEIHEAGKSFLENAPQHALTFGFNIEPISAPLKFIDEESEIKFGSSLLKIIYTPGHADGSVCFVSEESKLVIVGDVLFRESIGRTDLPTGNFDLLKESIQQKLFKLPDDYTAIPGHGPETSIGHEKQFNPFVGIN
jgi:hydroxyacylglutathione hydrolase